MTKKTIIQRIPVEIKSDVENALGMRFKNNLISRRDLKFTEGLRLIRRTPEWSSSLNKLATFPKKEESNVKIKKR
jgi:hypothetical protein